MAPWRSAQLGKTRTMCRKIPLAYPVRGAPISLQGRELPGCKRPPSAERLREYATRKNAHDVSEIPTCVLCPGSPPLCPGLRPGETHAPPSRWLLGGVRNSEKRARCVGKSHLRTLRGASSLTSRLLNWENAYGAFPMGPWRSTQLGKICKARRKFLLAYSYRRES